jgi:DHA3 family macrolide efflux protein-like MFS transporter
MLTPIQTTRNFGLDVWRLPAIELAFSIGMMLGGITIGAWGGFKNKSYTITLATAICGLISMALGLASNFWAYLAFMAICGISMPFFNTPLMTIFQTKVAPDYMGRVFSVLMMSGSVMMPLGMAFFGPMADVVSIDILLVATGIAIFLSSFLLAGSKTIREAGC